MFKTKQLSWKVIDFHFFTAADFVLYLSKIFRVNKKIISYDTSTGIRTKKSPSNEQNWHRHSKRIIITKQCISPANIPNFKTNVV